MTCSDLSDPTFDVTSAPVHAARDDSWHVEIDFGWAVLRHAEASAVLRDPRFRQGNTRALRFPILFTPTGLRGERA